MPKRSIRLPNNSINHLACFANAVDFIKKNEISGLFITNKFKFNLLKCKIYERKHIERPKRKIHRVKIDFRR